VTILSYNDRFIFVHVPKCGGTSIEIERERLGLSWGDFVIGSSMRGEVLAPIFSELYGIKKHSSARELQSIIGQSHWSKFDVSTIVREPRKIVESHYKFALGVMQQWAMQLVKSRNLDEAHLLDASKFIRDSINAMDTAWLPGSRVLGMTNGAIGAAMLSNSFAEFLERVIDNRWSNYLRSYTHDPSGNSLVQHVLKLEEPTSVETFFKRYFGQKFQLRNDNVGNSVDAHWSSAMLKRFYDLSQEEYAEFGYELPS
jgi:hypothetical protein